jgi:hypothetical protein
MMFSNKHLKNIYCQAICPTIYPTYHWVCNKNNTTGATCGAGTAYPSGAPEFTTCFSGVRVARSLAFSVVFCRSLFVLFFFWPLYCLSFYDLRLLITPLVQILIQIRKHKIPHCLFKTQYYLQAIAQCKNIQKTVKKISDNATHD